MSTAANAVSTRATGQRAAPALLLLALLTTTFVLAVQAGVLLVTNDIGNVPANLVLQLLLVTLFGFWSRAETGTFLNPTFMVVAAIYFWHSPFLTGHFLSSGPLFAFTGDVFTYGEEFVPQAVALVSLSLLAVTGGALAASLLPLRMRPAPDEGEISREISPVFGWSMFGAVLLVAAAYLVVQGPKTFGNEYMSLYTADEPDSPIGRLYDATNFFGVLAILIVFRVAKTRPQRLVAGLATLLLIFVNLLFGSRSMPFIYALTLLVAIDRYIRHIPFWILLAIGVGASALSFIIDHTRGSGLGLEILNFQRTGLSVDLFNIFWNAGSVVKTVLRTMAFTADTGLWGGRSFFSAFLSLMPTPLWNALGLSWNFLRPSVWLVENSSDVPLGGGLGYSLVGESYLNFGVAGFLIFFPLGWFLARQFRKGNRDPRSFGHLNSLNVAILLTLHMRNDFQTYFRTIVWGLLIVQMLRARIWQRRVRTGVLTEELA